MSKKFQKVGNDCPFTHTACADANSIQYAPIQGRLASEYVSFPVGGYKAWFPPGMALTQVPEARGNTYRFLPRAHTVEEVAAGATDIRLNYAGIFIPNDELSVLAPVGTFTIDAPVGADETDIAWKAGDDITITVDGFDVSFNLDAEVLKGRGDSAQSTLYMANKAISLEIAQLLTQQAPVIATAAAISPTVATPNPTGWVVSFIPTDHTTEYAYSATTDSADGMATAAGAAMAPAGAPLGMVAAVNPTADGSGLGSVTLAVPLSAAIPPGTPIGDANYSACSAGLADCVSAIAVEMGCDMPIAAFCEGSYKMANLPYWDGELKRCFPNIKVI